MRYAANDSVFGKRLRSGHDPRDVRVDALDGWPPGGLVFFALLALLGLRALTLLPFTFLLTLLDARIRQAAPREWTGPVALSGAFSLAWNLRRLAGERAARNREL